MAPSSYGPGRRASKRGQEHEQTPTARADRAVPAFTADRADGRARAEGVGARPGERSEPFSTFTHNLSAAGQDTGQWFALNRRKFRETDRANPEDRQERRDASRAERWEIRRKFRKVTESKRVRSCGRPGAREDGSVVLRVTDATGTHAERSTGATGRVAGYSGLFSCANVWLCQQCSSRIAATRAAELETVMSHHIARGGWAVLITLTNRHHRGHSLAQCLAGAAAGWQAVNSGGTWQADKQRTDYAGYARALEVTESPEHGWHVHFHVCAVFGSRPSAEALDRMAEGMFTRWSAGLVKAGMPAPLREYGLDVQHLDPDAGQGRTFETSRAWARYIAKGIAAESALGVAKQAKGQNRSIRQLMSDALIPQRWENPTTREIVETIDLTALDRLREFERAMKGCRQLTWSTGRHDLRKAAGLAEEATDEQIVEADIDGEEVAVISREGWRAVEPRATELLAVTERHGAEAACRWLDEHAIEWWRPTGLTPHYRRGEPPGSGG